MQMLSWQIGYNRLSWELLARCWNLKLWECVCCDLDPQCASGKWARTEPRGVSRIAEMEAAGEKPESGSWESGSGNRDGNWNGLGF